MNGNINCCDLRRIRSPYFLLLDPTLKKLGYAADAKAAGQMVNLAEEYSQKAELAAEQYPYIGEDGHWYIWNIETKLFEDSGLSAGLLYFEVESKDDFPEQGASGTIYVEHKDDSYGFYIWVDNTYLKLNGDGIIVDIISDLEIDNIME